MIRKPRKPAGTASDAPVAPAKGPCSICGLTDARALVAVELLGGDRIALCGTHELMHRRAAERACTIGELRALLAERRNSERRARLGEGDELAERLQDAFTANRRAVDRRAS